MLWGHLQTWLWALTCYTSPVPGCPGIKRGEPVSAPTAAGERVKTGRDKAGPQWMGPRAVGNSKCHHPPLPHPQRPNGPRA